MSATIDPSTLPTVHLTQGDDQTAVLDGPWKLEIRAYKLEVPQGASTDGASIPRALWAICGHPLETPRVYAALVHDGLYGNEAWSTSDMTRAEADAIYRDLLEALGISSWRAWVEYLALRACGSSHWTKRANQDKLTKEEK